MSTNQTRLFNWINLDQFQAVKDQSQNGNICQNCIDGRLFCDPYIKPVAVNLGHTSSQYYDRSMAAQGRYKISLEKLYFLGSEKLTQTRVIHIFNQEWLTVTRPTSNDGTAPYDVW